MLNFLTTSAIDTSTISLATVALTIIFSMVAGFIISFTYMKTADKGQYTQNFSLTLILLPMIIALIILLIGSNVARAFSLAGAFSIVRFRSAPGNPKDITYVFFSMASGLACGVGYFGYALLFTVILCLIMIVLGYIDFGKRKTTEKILKISIPENLNFEGVFDEILERYTENYTLSKVKTINMGSLYELDYAICMKNETEQKKFIDELRCKNGNLNITLSLVGDKAEF